MLVSQAEKLDFQIASLRSETGKRAKPLAGVVKQFIRSTTKDDYVLDFITENLGKDGQWRPWAAGLLHKTMEEEV